jgi:serine/threonine protein kinase
VHRDIKCDNLLITKNGASSCFTYLVCLYCEFFVCLFVLFFFSHIPPVLFSFFASGCCLFSCCSHTTTPPPPPHTHTHTHTHTGKIKLADFGIAVHKKAEAVSGDEQTGPLGSPYWMAPEIIELQDPTPKADIWSVGCTIIELLTGNPPYYELSKMQAMFAMVNDPHPPVPKHPHPSDLIIDVLKHCFQRDPNKRPSAAHLLKHPFIPQIIDEDDDLLKVLWRDRCVV